MAISMQRKRLWGLILATLVGVAANFVYFSIRFRSNLWANHGKNSAPGAEKKEIGEAKMSEQLKSALENVNADGLSQAVATIQTARGKIQFKFFTKDAPVTSARIAELIQQGFYNGVIFHRVEPQFVIQTGDPTGTGTSGSGKKLKAEFNTRKHVLGTVAMARTSDPNSADSQFYICLGPHPFLDNQYTVFGQLIDGVDVIKQIQRGDQMTSVTIDF